ncbi:DUF434 domain-containing protein [Bacteroidota bacterium]
MKIRENFKKAITDYLYLLERSFPQKSIIKLIGDRYLLSKVERGILYRGITTSANAEFRKTKSANEKQIKNKALHIDAYNVLITIGSYLNGNTVFISTDGILRDASEIHGKVFRSQLLEKSLILIFDYFKHLKTNEVHFYVDQPISNSGNLSTHINSLIKESGLKGLSETVNSPDYILKNNNIEICCTSDSAIIDNCSGEYFDLAYHTLVFHYNPDFIDFRDLVINS